MVKVAHVLALSISACPGRCLQIDEEHVKIDNPVDSLRMLLTAINSEFKWHQPTRHYLVARAPLCSRSLGRLRGGGEGAQSSSGEDDSDGTGVVEKAPRAPAPAPAFGDAQKLAKLGYSQADIAQLSPDRIPTILKMNIRRPASGVPRQWCSAGAKKKKANSSKSKGSLRPFSTAVLGATGVTVLLGTLGKLVTGKSRKKPVVVDKESFLGGLFSFDDYAVNCRNWWQTGDPRHLFRRKWMKVGALSLDLLFTLTSESSSFFWNLLMLPCPYAFGVVCVPQQEEPFWKKPFGLR